MACHHLTYLLTLCCRRGGVGGWIGGRCKSGSPQIGIKYALCIAILRSAFCRISSACLISSLVNTEMCFLWLNDYYLDVVARYTAEAHCIAEL